MFPAFAFLAAAFSLATFSCGVSLGRLGDGVVLGNAEMCGGLEWACGIVAVKRVASAAERGIFAEGMRRGVRVARLRNGLELVYLAKGWGSLLGHALVDMG
jgi:hypothetical protein